MPIVIMQPILSVGLGWSVRTLTTSTEDARRFPSCWSGYNGEAWAMERFGGWNYWWKVRT